MNVDALLEAAGWWSYLVVFAVTAAETSAFVGLLVPGEAAVLVASALAGHGELNALLLAVVVVAGGMTGGNLGYALGHRCKHRPNARPARHARPDNRIGRAQAGCRLWRIVVASTSMRPGMATAMTRGLRGGRRR